MEIPELQVQEAPSVRVFDDIQDLVQELVSISTLLAWAIDIFPKNLEDLSSLLIDYPVQRENFLRQHANISQNIIEIVFRPQRTVLEGSLTLFSATAKSQDAFSLTTLAKALQDIRKQLNNVVELLQLAQNKKNLVCLTLTTSPNHRYRKADFRLTTNFGTVEPGKLHP